MREIKQARKICKITQSEFAKMLNMDQSNYCNIENDKLMPNNILELKNLAISILLPGLDCAISLKFKEMEGLVKLRESILDEKADKP